MELVKESQLIMRFEERERLLKEALRAGISELEHAKRSFEELRMMCIQGEQINEGTLRVWANKYRRAIERLQVALRDDGTATGSSGG